MHTKRNNTECNTTRENLFSWMENRLSPEESTALQRHLENCAECRFLAGEFRETEGLIARDRQLQANPFISTRIMQAIDAQINTRERVSRGLLVRLVQPAVLVAGLAIAILTGIYLGRHETRQYSDAARHPENIREMQASFFIPEFANEDQAVTLER